MAGKSQKSAADPAAAEKSAAPDRITLCQSYVDNGLNTRPAGSVLILGHGAGEIDSDRANYLVEQGVAVFGEQAVEENSPEPDAKTGADSGQAG